MGDGHTVLTLVAYGALCFSVALIGGLAGLVLGNLRLPFSVGLADSVAAGGGANVAISGVAAAVAAVGHVRGGRVDWRLLAWLAPPSLVGGLLGGLLAGSLPQELLLVGIATILYYSSWELWRWQMPARGGAQPTPSADTAGRYGKLQAGLIGLVTGILGGAVGLILGALRLPALLKFTTVSPRILVGTNLLAGVAVAIAGAAGHMLASGAGFDTTLFLVGAVASVPGAWFGSKLTGRLPVATLIHAIAGILLIAASAMVAQAIAQWS